MESTFRGVVRLASGKWHENKSHENFLSMAYKGFQQNFAPAQHTKFSILKVRAIQNSCMVGGLL